MTEIGYTLSSEEFGPRDLVRFARRAEEAGFRFSLISDHFHPWIDHQGHSPFVWGVLGALSEATERMTFGTGVTCPTIRIHPAILAQAAATASLLLEGRFFLGVGSGENLNEHILGDRWPAAAMRLEMLEEAVEVMRHLWEGGPKSFSGTHYRVENARIYDLPDRPVPVMVAAAGDEAAELAGRIGDGFIGTSPDEETVGAFERAGGEGKPRYGQLTVCWAPDQAEARKTAHAWWPNSAMGGELAQELPLPRHFEQAAEMLSEDDVADSMPHGPDPEAYLDAIREYAEAGYTHVYLHQVGPDQDGFIRFCEQEVLPKLG